MKTLLIIVAVVIGLYVLLRLWKTHKEPRIPDVGLITGGVKCGKTSASLYLAYRQYKRNLFKWQCKCFLIEKLWRTEYPEKPLLYSSIPLSVPHVLVTQDLILRKIRPAFKSVCFIDEASLLADSFDFKDDEVNEQIKLFNKLWGHMTHGGQLIYNTQNESDLHYNIKRCLGSYIWIHRTIKWIPFVLVFMCREMVYSESNNAVNVFNEDVEDTLKWIVCSKRIWKKFDCYCFSHYTDDHQPDERVIEKPTTLKAEVVSFKKYSQLKGKTNEKTIQTLPRKGSGNT